MIALPTPPRAGFLMPARYARFLQHHDVLARAYASVFKL